MKPEMISANLHATPWALAAEQSKRWQSRRAHLLQEACMYVASQMATGVKLVRAISLAARKIRHRSLGCGRKLALSRKSLERHWYKWNAGSRNETAFKLYYVPGRSQEVDPALLRVITEGCIRQSKSIAESFREVSLSSSGLVGSSASLCTICRVLPAKAIAHFLRSERRLIAQRGAAEQKVIALAKRIRDLRLAAEKKFLFLEGSAK